MTTIPKRRLTDTQIRIIRGKAKKAKTVQAPANDVTAETRKTLPADAFPVRLDLSSSTITKDVTQRGIDRISVGEGWNRIVAYGQIALMIAEAGRIDGFGVIRGEAMKIIGFQSGDFVIDENGDDWIAPSTDDRLPLAA